MAVVVSVLSSRMGAGGEERGGESAHSSLGREVSAVRLDECADVLVPLELGPCAAPTVTRLERVEVTTGTSHACSEGGGGWTNQDATRETRKREGRPFACVRMCRRFRARRSSEESQLSRVVAWALG